MSQNCPPKKGTSQKAVNLSRRQFLQAAGVTAAGLIVAGCQPNQSSSDASKTQTPLGVGRGIHPGRVVWAHNPKATAWDGNRGIWWDDKNIDQAAVLDMVSQGLRQQSGEKDDRSAWEAIFAYFNQARGRGSQGYQPGEKIAVKINVNNCGTHNYFGRGSYDAPQVVYALLMQLVSQAGVPPDAITAYDAIRYIPDGIYKRCQTPELAGVRFVDWTGGDGREQYQRDEAVQVHWSGDATGNATYLPTAVTQADYMINIAGLKGHNLAGITLTGKNHFGTILAEWEGEMKQQTPQGAGIHHTVAAHPYDSGPGWKWETRPAGTYNAIVDLMGHSHLGGKTLLYVIDGLYAAQHQQADLDANSRWQSAPFNGHWTSSLFFSQDGVAIDSVGFDLLNHEPTILALPDVLPEGHTAENYLHEASQADKPPSGTRYDPDGSGKGLASLGVHDHWNNPEKKKYARNLGKSEGIELVMVS